MFACLQFLYLGDEASDGGADVGGAAGADDALLSLHQSTRQVAALQNSIHCHQFQLDFQSTTTRLPQSAQIVIIINHIHLLHK